jgi:hypothetical protein
VRALKQSLAVHIVSYTSILLVVLEVLVQAHHSFTTLLLIPNGNGLKVSSASEVAVHSPSSRRSHHQRSAKPEPGMNAFTWELLTQAIALNMVKHQCAELPGYSDCTSAITRTNQALRSFVNPLAHTRGGLWASAAHVFSNYRSPRRFILSHQGAPGAGS